MKKPLETLQPDAIVARLNELDVEKVQKMKAPSSTTLTDEQIEMIKGGVFIEGVLLGYNNLVLFPPLETASLYRGVYVGLNTIGIYVITKSTKVISFGSETTPLISFKSLGSVNGKAFPDYPAGNVTKYNKCANGTLSWGDVNMEDIVDAQGNKRFVEGDITIEEITGVTQTYGKWSLSGTHLMIVVAGNIANGTQTSNLGILANISLPTFILDKLVPIFSNLLDYKSPVAYAANWATQSYPLSLQKGSDKIQLRFESNVTTSADRSFRWQFDFLIDTEAPTPTE